MPNTIRLYNTPGSMKEHLESFSLRSLSSSKGHPGFFGTISKMTSDPEEHVEVDFSKLQIPQH